jgi:uncharacterized protein (TIGR00730 family)
MTNPTEIADKSTGITSLSLCVFCGARTGHNPKHMELAVKLGAAIAEKGHSLVYGGGGLGLMGAVAKSAFDSGAQVTGIIPHFLKEAERMLECVDHIYVETMHERKLAMYDKADAFIVLPGGIGTLEEAVEVLSWLRLNLHTKPVVFLSDAGYWEALLATFHHVVDNGFASEETREDLLSATSVDQTLDIITHEITHPREREPLQLDKGDKGVLELG